MLPTTLNPQYDSQRLITTHTKLDQQIQTSFIKFLQNWQDGSERKYINQAGVLLAAAKHIMTVSSKDLYSFSHDLADTVFNQYSRYEPLLNRTLTVFMHQVEKDINGSDVQVDILKDREQDNELEQYEIAFDKASFLDDIGSSVRNLKCEMLGKLRSIVGTVTRVSEIRPQLLQGVFECKFCGRMSEKISQQYKYTTPKKCLAQGCGNNTLWQLNNKRSTFADFQKVRVQQDASKIPPGSMPRSIDVILRNQNIQKGQPGDQIHVVGYLTVIPDIQSLLKPGERTSMFTKNPNTRRQVDQQGINGIKGIKQLSYKLCFIGNNVFVMNNQFNQEILTQEEAEDHEVGYDDGYDEEAMITKLFEKLNETEILEIKRIKEHPKVYENLAESLFDEIFGHIEIKKALLLQLLGGVHKKTSTKISLRGDINILIVGDPSTAKSQFLKCVDKFVPRSVYTNGKTTTAAGLTASVVRDPQSGNVSIEAGALLLADNGICCIDEFDKMDIKDQVAIHEAMEQQTISIAKAGIQATLHARTSILAAANPIFGRYDKTQSLRKNINISPPIMSRFDLYFIICDETNQFSDKNLSEFIVSMHKNKKQIKIPKPHTINQVKKYLSIAKRIKPRITKQAAEDLRKYYVNLRKNDKQQQNSQYQVTVRQLQSMIRLSEAMAKLHLDFEVKSQYVREAYRLLSCAIVKLQKSVIQLSDQKGISQSDKQSLGLRSILNSRRQPQKKQRKVILSHEQFTFIKEQIYKLFEQKQKKDVYEQEQNKGADEQEQNKGADEQEQNKGADEQKQQMNLDEQHEQDKQEQFINYKTADVLLTQEDIIAYLFTIRYQNGDLSSENDNMNRQKLYHAVINHMIKENMLMVLEENEKAYLRKITVHPNVDFDVPKTVKKSKQKKASTVVKG